MASGLKYKSFLWFAVIAFELDFFSIEDALYRIDVFP